MTRRFYFVIAFIVACSFAFWYFGLITFRQQPASAETIVGGPVADLGVASTCGEAFRRSREHQDATRTAGEVHCPDNSSVVVTDLPGPSDQEFYATRHETSRD